MKLRHFNICVPAPDGAGPELRHSCHCSIVSGHIRIETPNSPPKFSQAYTEFRLFARDQLRPETARRLKSFYPN